MSGKSAVVFLSVLMLICSCDAKHDSCKALLKEYSHSLSTFVDHAGRYSEPFTFCNGSSDYYRVVQLTYDTLASGTDIVTKKKCHQMYFDTNKFNMLEYLKSVADKLWKDAFCYDCFEPLTNTSSHYVFTNYTLDFYEYHKNYNNCLTEYFNSTGPKVPPAKRINTTLCNYCDGNYTLLNKLYDSYSKHRAGQVCFDLTDLVSLVQLILLPPRSRGGFNSL
jgi:hypothetical protein